MFRSQTPSQGKAGPKTPPFPIFPILFPLIFPIGVFIAANIIQIARLRQIASRLSRLVEQFEKQQSQELKTASKGKKGR